MQMIAFGKVQPMPIRAGKRQLFFIVAILFSSFVQGQTISLSLQNVPLEKVFREIESKVEQRFVYTREMLDQSKPVSLSVRNISLQNLLAQVFQEQPLSFSVSDKFIKVSFKTVSPVTMPSRLTVQGRILDETGQFLTGVTVTAKGSGKSAASDNIGAFLLKDIDDDDVLLITSIGYKDMHVPVNGRTRIDVQMQVVYNALDETIIIAYGTTSRRLSTGNVSKVSKEDIAAQPVANVLAALEGRVAGLVVTQSSGVPGSAIKLQVRGQNSLLQGSEPLFILDGVPLSAGNNSINQVTNSSGSAGLSPLNLINPADIESIEVLKDADATAIYGSRGANGVVLITTKKGKAGKTKFNVNVYRGTSKVTRTMNLLSTEQYLQMRREAFRNDGVTPTPISAPDLLLWDTTRYTDIKKLLIGGTAKSLDAQASLSGGNLTTNFTLGSSYHRETTVFPGDLSDKRASAHLNVNHSSLDKKFNFSITTSYSYEKNNLVASDLTGNINLPPHVHLYDSLGNLNWKEGGTAFRNLFGTNPLAVLNRKYNGEYQHLLSNAQIGYTTFLGLRLKLSAGYNTLAGDEVLINPRASIDPASSALASSNFGNSSFRTWIIEPQADYEKRIGKGTLSVLVGTTFQSNNNKSVTTAATNYTSDLLLNNIGSAGSTVTNNNALQYRYTAIYGRLTANWWDKYVLNVTGRRDGSSRFGPEKQFSNFGAVGAAWIFSKEAFIQKHLPCVSYGKLRGSYGITGNDQIGDYQFLDTWTVTNPTTYQSVPGLRPSRLFNPDYSWEINKKLEAAIELGFLKERILFSASYYSNKSSNQLVNYSLPIQTGFGAVVRNLDALIENSGWEFLLNTQNLQGKNVKWKTALNISLPRNRLLAFPNLASSSYANTYVIGEPLSIRKLLLFTGVDPVSGTYSFQDIDGNGTLTLADRQTLRNTSPRFYGGLQNSVQYKNLELSIFFEFRKQLGRNYLFTQSTNVPGYGYLNQPVVVLDRWQKTGTMPPVQKFTQDVNSVAYLNATNYLVTSDAVYSDASFIRCKNIAVNAYLPQHWVKKISLENLRLYVQCQNLFTITSYVGADPENQSIYILPPLRTIAAGILLNF